MDRRYFKNARDKKNFHLFADASEDKVGAIAYLLSQPIELSADLATASKNAELLR